MIHDIKGVIHYLVVNVRYAFMIFWSILLSIYLISLLLSTIGDRSNVMFQASIPIYIFCLVIGMWTVKNTIPYLLKMGVTRKLIYAGTGVYFLGLAIFQSLLANTLIKFTEALGKSAISGDVTIFDGHEEVSFQFMHVSQFLENDTFITQVTVDSIISFTALSTMFFIGLIFYRYGLIGGFTSLGVLFFLYILSIAQGAFVELITYIMENYSLVLYFQLFAISILIYGLSFLLIRRLTIVS